MAQTIKVVNLQDLEDLVLQVVVNNTLAAIQPARRTRAVRIIAAAAGDYAAADVMSNNVTDTLGLPNAVLNVVNVPGDTAILDMVSATCNEDSILARQRLHWYNYQPLPADVEMDDNIAADWAKVDAGRVGYIGYTDLPAFADRGTAMSHSQAVNLRQELPTKAGSTGLFYVVEWLDAEANETAGMVVDYTLHFLN